MFPNAIGIVSQGHMKIKAFKVNYQMYYSLQLQRSFI